MANNNSGKNEKDLVCSFCGKHQDEVERMIIGPGVNICSECIGLCHDLLHVLKPCKIRAETVHLLSDK